MGAGADAGALPPEVNYTNMTLGDQMISMSLAAGAHEGLAGLIAGEMAVMGVNTAATAMEWIGLGGVAMTMSATELQAVLALLEAWFNTGGAALLEVVGAYHAAVAAMIPAPVSLTNRSTQASLVATNFLGFNTPAINALDITYGEHWTQNASLAGTFEATAMATVASLAVPPPLAPPVSNPASAAAGGAGSLADSGANVLQSSFSQATNLSSSGGSVAKSGSGTDMMSNMLPTLLGPMTQLTSVANPSMFAQAPQALSQGAGQFSSMLGPLMSPSAVGASATPVSTVASTVTAPVTSAGSGITGLGGNAGTGLVTPASTFTRPVSSFSPPSSPQLPGAWKNARPAVAGEQPVGFNGGGGGGLYGAPASAMMGRGEAGGAHAQNERAKTLTVSSKREI